MKKLKDKTIVIKDNKLYIDGIDSHFPETIQNESEVVLNDNLISCRCYKFINKKWKQSSEAIIDKKMIDIEGTGVEKRHLSIFKKLFGGRK